MEQAKEKIYRFCDRASMILLCMLMADCCIFGGGKLISVGPIGFRMMLLFVLLVVSVPLIVANIKNVLKNRFIWMLAAFGIWLAVSAVMGFSNGNNTGILAADIKGFCYFALLPAALCILRSKERVYTLMKVMMYAAAAFAVIHIVFMIMYLTSRETYDLITQYGNSNFLSRAGWISQKIPRLFLTSVMYLLCACTFPLYFFVKHEKKIWYPIITGIALFGLLLTYTRSVYLGVIIAALGCGAVCLFGCTGEMRKRLLVFVLTAVITFGVVVGTFSVTQKTNYFGFAISRSATTFDGKTGGDDDTPSTSTPDGKDKTDEEIQLDKYLEITKNSDFLRKETLRELFEHIKEAPVAGKGLGVGLEVRDDGKGFNEYIYLDIWAKTGIVGLLLFVFPALAMLVESIRKHKKNICRWTWVFTLLGFMAFSFFNPYMNAALGVLLYCCVMAVCSIKDVPDGEARE